MLIASVIRLRFLIPYGITVHGIMRIRSIRHQGLRRLVEADGAREIRSDLVNRVRRILTALISAADMNGVQGRPAGVSTGLPVTAPVPGVCRHSATGGSPLPWTMEKYAP